MTPLRILAFAVVAAAASSLAGAVFASSASSPAASSNDPTGKAQLGVDISKAGNTPAQNKNFIATLPAAQQASVNRACLVVVNATRPEPAPVMAFCKNIASR